MNKHEIFSLSGNNPVLLEDGKMGLLIRWPGDADNLCGIQVPGEEEIRWIDCGNITDAGGGALKFNIEVNP